MLSHLDHISRFFESRVLCLENCHEDKALGFKFTNSSGNGLINHYDTSLQTSDSLATDLNKFREALSDLIKQVEMGSLESWSAFYNYSGVITSLYKWRDDDKVCSLLLWMCRGLWQSLEFKWEPIMHTPFLVKFISLLESGGYYAEGIGICDYAIEKGIPDNTQKGYAGRKQRLNNKIKKFGESKNIDWVSVKNSAEMFFTHEFDTVPNKFDAISRLVEQIKSFCDKAKSLPEECRISAFQDFKHEILPEIEAHLSEEEEVAIGSSWTSYRWLYKELYRLESAYYNWCNKPILGWYRDTEQSPDTWPQWLIREYRSSNRLEYRLYANDSPFTALDIYALTSSPLTTWGLNYGFEQILSHITESLLEYRQQTGQCFVRSFFEDTSYWSAGRISKDETKKQIETFKDLIEIGFFKDKQDRLKYPLSLRKVHAHIGAVLYDFPKNIHAQYLWLPDIPKLNLSYKIRELFREAENKVREKSGVPHVGAGWISEAQLLAYITSCYPDEIVISQGSPPWLGRQRFDIYFPKKKIAIEYQGIQHFQPVEFFGGELGFKETQERDENKRRKCKENNCVLIEVLPDYDEEELIRAINEALI